LGFLAPIEPISFLFFFSKNKKIKAKAGKWFVENAQAFCYKNKKKSCIG
jgi:hypothetical protein